MSHLQKVRRLYKTILKLHRGLPQELQALGTNYVKDEFKRHMKCNTNEAKVFMNEWTIYTLSLAEQLGLQGPKHAKVLGESIPSERLDALRDEQIMQLYELMQAAAAENTNSQEQEENNRK